MPDLAHTTIADSIATLTMNRPEARNALSAGLIDALAQALERIEAYNLEVPGMEYFREQRSVRSQPFDTSSGFSESIDNVIESSAASVLQRLR